MTEDEIDDLFAVEMPPRKQGVIRKEVAKATMPWQVLWDEWSRLTERPASPIPTSFVRTVRRRMRESMPHSEMMDRVRAAAYLTPPSDDSSDTIRVTKALSNTKVYRQACRERDVEGAERIVFFEHDENEVLSSLQDVVSVTGLSRNRLTRSELSAAMALQMYTLDELEEFAFRTRKRLGSVVAYPSEIVREADAEMQVEGVVDADVSVSGTSPDDVLLAADTLATQMHLRGASPATVRKLHMEAPSGYWERVLRDRDQTRKPLSAVYDALESEYDWHPSRREAL